MPGAGCLLRRTGVYDFSSVAQERSCLSAGCPGQKETLRVTFIQGLAHPDPIPRGFGLQRKEQILSWQYTLLSDVAAAKREGLVHLLLKNHELVHSQPMQGVVAALAVCRVCCL